MKHIACRTEFSYRFAYGPLKKVAEAGGIGICDRNGTWGHVRWAKECKTPIFGVELGVVERTDKREKQPPAYYRFIAKNQDGLNEIYQLTTLASRGFYYSARLGREDLRYSKNIVTIAPDYDWRLAPVWAHVGLTQFSTTANFNRATNKGLYPLAICDNYYPRPEHIKAYEIVAGRTAERRSAPMHMLSESEWRYQVGWSAVIKESLAENEKLFAECLGVKLPKAEMIKFHSSKTLRELCEEGAQHRHIDLNNEVYAARLERELSMIKEKDFEDYFFVIADMIAYAKQHMLVGPARGSSCGSLACYLLGITDIDPIPFGLLFERFIDITRADLPDIDIDFQDDRREMVFEYLRQKYGQQHIARIGNVNRYKASSALRDVSGTLKIPQWEIDGVKNAMLKRSSGDARAMLCILDTLNDTEVGKQLLKKYPQVAVAAELENHATHSGQHAAGVAITQEHIANYCSIDEHLGVAQIDKKDAEDLGILKIDALGLRTLSIIQDCLDSVGWTREQLLAHPFDDRKAFDVINNGKFSGVFQFEGAALQNLCRQMKVENFEDLVSLTALARPGPLVSGGATDFLNRRTGKEAVKYLHPLAEAATKVTLGCIVYQEQVMQLGREIGALTWEDVSTLRKAMSKSFGKEYFDKFFEKFWSGAEKNGLTLKEATHVWEHMNTMGSWSFNRSHAVAYGLVSYWCCILKARFPLYFAAACLRNAKDDEQGILLLRELANEGFKYKAYDKEKSQLNWSVQDEILVGGLTNIKGVGNKIAEQIIEYREKGIPLTPRMNSLLENGETPYDLLFEAKERFGDYYLDPEKYGITSSEVRFTNDIISEHRDQNDVIFLGKLLTKNIRSTNEAINVQRGRSKVYKGNPLSLIFNIADDTGFLRCRISEREYLKIGKEIAESGIVEEDWYLVKGNFSVKFNMVFVTKIRKLT